MKSSNLSSLAVALLFVAAFALSGCSADSLTGPEAEVPTDDTVQTESQSCDPNCTDPPDGHNTDPNDY